jgi:hypothetical protein
MLPNRYFLAFILFALLLWRAAPSAYATAPPDLIVLNHLSRIYEEVTFDHEMHNGYAACVECHHHLTGSPPSNPTCSACHRQGITGTAVGCRDCHSGRRPVEQPEDRKQVVERYHIDIPGLSGAYHLRCLRCHLSITAGPTGCQGCHIMKKER